MIKVGDSTIPWNDQFKFFITTKLPNPHYPPEVCVKVSLLNFAITFSGLEDQLLGVAVVEEMSGAVPPAILDSLLLSLRSNSFKKMEEAVSALMCEGYPALQVLKTLSNRLVSLGEDSLDDMSKGQISIKIAEANKRLIDGADEYLQLMDVSSICVRCFQECRLKGVLAGRE